MVGGLLGKKLGMTQVFSEDGGVTSVTVIEAGPCHVMQIKTAERDGYTALQLGLDDKKRKNATKPESGHARAAKAEPKRFLCEIHTEENEDVQLGEVLTVALFENAASVDVTGTSKGKGFQGVMKRHGFHGNSASHGASKDHRAPGSIGQSSDPSRVFKGVRMPGHMGNVRTTCRNLRVVRVDAERNLLLVKGAVPGPAGGYVIVRANKMKDSK